MAVVRIQKRRGTAAAWTAANPVLAAGEEGYETDTKKLKIGDGATAWSALSYRLSDPSSVAITGGSIKGTVEAQPAESVVIEVDAYKPFTAGFAPFQQHFNSFPNINGGAGTYNHAVHYGFNAGRHSSGSVTAGRPAMIMGFEDNYYDWQNSLKYGPEWYIEYWSPDGTSQQMFRPFYCRVEGSDSNASNNATITHDIGTDGTGVFSVRAGPSNGLFSIYPTFLSVGLSGTEQLRLGAVGPSSKPGLTILSDINLYRNAAGVMKTDGSLVVGDATTNRTLTIAGLSGSGGGSKLTFTGGGGRQWTVNVNDSAKSASAYVISDDSAGFDRFCLDINGNMGVNTNAQFGGGSGVIGIKTATTLPTTNPTGGGVLYVDAGALKYRGSSGTVTTLGVA